MAKIIANVPDADIDELIEDFALVYGYQSVDAESESSMTSEEFMRTKVNEYFQNVKAEAARIRAQAAEKAAIAEAKAKAKRITI